MQNEQEVKDQPIPGWITFLLAASCGIIVANLYYAQTLVGPISAATGLSSAAAGLIVTITQIGYVLGLLFIVPLSDIIENRLSCRGFADRRHNCSSGRDFRPSCSPVPDGFLFYWIRFCCRSNSGPLCYLFGF